MAVRTVTRVIPAARTAEGDGMIVQRAFPNQSLGRLDPFLLLDEMGPIQFEPGATAGFPDHPHRGFETVTYLLEGEFEHRDSHGNRGFLRPGDVQWMTAGAGVVHSEMPSTNLRKAGGRLRGLQLWVNLPKKDKMMPPRYQEFPGAKIPEANVSGARVKVIAGTFSGVSAVIATRTPIQYFHAHLEPGAAVTLPVPDGHQGFFYALDGEGDVGGAPVESHRLAILGHAGEDVVVQAAEKGLDGIFVTGKPIGEPVFQYGPFVMTTRDEIVQAVEDFRAGRFGEIAATH
jgi:redox-sensitive bicupin YhaK (pirin superfamily)